MNPRVLDNDEIASVLQQAEFEKRGYPIPEQLGPLRFCDKEMRCINSPKGTCHSPTHWRLEGIPTCSVHALYKMNRMLYERGVN